MLFSMGVEGKHDFYGSWKDMAVEESTKVIKGLIGIAFQRLGQGGLFTFITPLRRIFLYFMKSPRIN